MSEWFLTLTAISLPLSSLWAAATPDGTVTRPSAPSGSRPFTKGSATFAATEGTTKSYNSGAKLLDAGGLMNSRNYSVAPLSLVGGEKDWKEDA